MSLEGDSDGEGAPRKTHDSNVVSKMRNSLIRRVGGGSGGGGRGESGGQKESWQVPQSVHR